MKMYTDCDSSRVLVIGLDGATLDLALPWMQQGYLPNLKRLVENGKAAQLQSVLPVISAAAWVTFMTGVNPGKHGVYDFVTRAPHSYKLIPTSRRDIRVPTLWQLLSNHGRRVFVMNVPLTYPPEPVNGIMISGLGTPNLKTFTNPPELSDTLSKQGYRVNRRIFYSKQDKDGFLKDSQELIVHITNTACEFLAQNRWDFAMVVYRETDDVPHGFWHDMDPTHPKHVPGSRYQHVIRDTYQALDQAIGKLLNAAGPETNVFVVSDHGFGPLYKDVFLNEWLRQKGYLKMKSAYQAKSLVGKLGITRNNISRVLRGMGLMSVERWIKDILGDKIGILPQDKWPDFHAGIDWEHTLAYSRGFQGQIFINLKGRDPQGVVPIDDYNRLRDALINDLHTLRDPEDGQPVISKIYTREMLYDGEYISSAPDLVLVMRDLAYTTRLGYELGQQPGQIFGESRVGETGGHRQNGLLIASGPDLNSAHNLAPDVWLGDLAPTILHLLNCPVPDWMDGTVQLEWLSPSVASREIIYTTESLNAPSNNAMTETESEEMMQRLRDLGYL
ncbi:MAG: alkaline phosphatase family protein [Anaerolineales bacterium]